MTQQVIILVRVISMVLVWAPMKSRHYAVQLMVIQSISHPNHLMRLISLIRIFPKQILLVLYRTGQFAQIYRQMPHLDRMVSLSRARISIQHIQNIMVRHIKMSRLYQPKQHMKMSRTIPVRKGMVWRRLETIIRVTAKPPRAVVLAPGGIG